MERMGAMRLALAGYMTHGDMLYYMGKLDEVRARGYYSVGKRAPFRSLCRFVT